MPLNGIFILAELPPEIAGRVREINERYDPKLSRYKPPHLTLTGSSGAGPLPPSVSVEEMREKRLGRYSDRRSEAKCSVAAMLYVTPV